MDRRRRRTRALALVLALGATTGLAADTPAPLRAMRWVSADADVVQALTQMPTECVRPPDAAATRQALEIGRAAFRTPILLGGQAARAGLSCESCHRSGRDNPDFQFPGASGAPGTADVTLSLFSSHRGNGVHDPRRIPDLSGPRNLLKVTAADLPAFIRGLIVEEFDGPEPSPAVLEGLAAYVEALNPTACPKQAQSPITLATTIGDADRALAAAGPVLARNDGPTAILLIAAARAQLGLIDERYGALPRGRTATRRVDADLAGLQASVRERRPETLAQLADARASLAVLQARLTPRESSSLFNPNQLRRATNARLPPRPS